MSIDTLYQKFAILGDPSIKCCLSYCGKAAG